MSKNALFIGRFQPFHKGHRNAATTAAEEYDLVIGIGSAQKSGTMENPLSFTERKTILNACLPDTPIERFEDRDSNKEWTEMVENTVNFDIVISGNSLVRQLLSERGHKVQDPDFLKPEQYSGTEIRQRVVEGEEWKHLVPDCSLELLKQFDFEEQLQKIAKH